MSVNDKHNIVWCHVKVDFYKYVKYSRQYQSNNAHTCDEHTLRIAKKVSQDEDSIQPGLLVFLDPLHPTSIKASKVILNRCNFVGQLESGTFNAMLSQLNNRRNKITHFVSLFILANHTLPHVSLVYHFNPSSSLITCLAPLF
ncbi:hypothetical protein Hanom_Chr11g01032821 [Helianthus anomalus]